MDDAFIGEIRVITWGWAPEGWLLCNGQSLSVQQYQALFAVLGTKFGGDGKTTFKVPDLQAKTVSCAGQAPGQLVRVFAQPYGSETVTLTTAQVPPHTHGLLVGKPTTEVTAYVPTPAPNTYVGHGTTSGDQSYTSQTTPLSPMSPSSVSVVGTGGPHENRQPFLVMNYIICYDGEFPVKS